MTDGWDPAQYARFSDERRAPFLDLMALLEDTPDARVLDIGCGDGEHMALLHERLRARRTLGVDSSKNMLARAQAHAPPGVQVHSARIQDFEPAERFDLVFSNAVLHWVSDHPRVFERMTGWLDPGGQLAIQMPDNSAHASHRVAREIASEEPYASAVGELMPSPVLAPERYAELLAKLGYQRQSVRLQVYGHWLLTASEVVEWVKGSLLSTFRARLSPALFERFVAAYRERLLASLNVPRDAPYFYTYRRVLLWARRPGR